MEDELREILAGAGYDDWEVVNDAVLLSPNGHRIEYDGSSPDGEVSPLIELGLI